MPLSIKVKGPFVDASEVCIAATQVAQCTVQIIDSLGILAGIVPDGSPESLDFTQIK